MLTSQSKSPQASGSNAWRAAAVTRIEIKCTTDVKPLNYPYTTPLPLVCGKTLLHETVPGARKVGDRCLKAYKMNYRKTHLSFNWLYKQVRESPAWICMTPSSWSLSELEDLSRSWVCCWRLGKFVFLFCVVTSQEEICWQKHQRWSDTSSPLGVCRKQGVLMQMKKLSHFALNVLSSTKRCVKHRFWFHSMMSYFISDPLNTGSHKCSQAVC